MKRYPVLKKPALIEKLEKACRSIFRSKAETSKAWEGLLGGVEKLLLRNQSIRLGNLGTLCVVAIPERTRTRRNPHTGENFKKHEPAHRRIKFYPSSKYRRLPEKG